MSTLAERIQAVMDAKGITQAELARKTGMTTSNVAYIVNGKTKDPRLQSVVLIAQALEVPLDYLAGVTYHYHYITLDDHKEDS